MESREIRFVPGHLIELSNLISDMLKGAFEACVRHPVIWWPLRPRIIPCPVDYIRVSLKCVSCLRTRTFRTGKNRLIVSSIAVKTFTWISHTTWLESFESNWLPRKVRIKMFYLHTPTLQYLCNLRALGNHRVRCHLVTSHSSHSPRYLFHQTIAGQGLQIHSKPQALLQPPRSMPSIGV